MTAQVFDFKPKAAPVVETHGSLHFSMDANNELTGFWLDGDIDPRVMVEIVREAQMWAAKHVLEIYGEMPEDVVAQITLRRGGMINTSFETGCFQTAEQVEWLGRQLLRSHEIITEE